ncbi:MAG: hypothetical protein QGF38_13810, partial [Rhodospirillales bacterium]|nr:hypothetical protein [Rhodospirillales bacterium]
EKKDQENDHPEAPLETSTPSGLTSNQDEPDPQLSNRLRRPNCFDDGQTSVMGRASSFLFPRLAERSNGPNGFRVLSSGFDAKELVVLS